MYAGSSLLTSSRVCQLFPPHHLLPPPVLPAAAGEIVSPGARRRRGRGEGEGIGKGLDESKMEVEKGENFGI